MPSHPISVIVIIEVVDLDKKEMVWMAKVSIEVHSGTARFTVAIKAQSIRQALSLQRWPKPLTLSREASLAIQVAVGACHSRTRTRTLCAPVTIYRVNNYEYRCITAKEKGDIHGTKDHRPLELARRVKLRPSPRGKRH